ncbi:MAG: leucyl/phenylalanyl-tRNA--protein transferase [Acidimicrobiia bacterium]|nr:leucyl/phenylalanyl-tRNA--protein transferase [Acidimicrobiia bacterium]
MSPGPIEPPASVWQLPSPADADDTGLLGVGADLAPGTLLTAYRSGMFPMPVGASGPLGWWSPDPRGVLPLDGLTVSRSLRRSLRDFEVRVDTAFSEVMAACAEPARPGGWITPAFEAAYYDLHRLGWAHSVEAWTLDGELAGGLYGVAIGGLFVGESMFHRRRDASKAALVGLVELLAADRDPRRLLDVQWRTDHLATLGVIETPRDHYLRRLAVTLAAPLPEPWV